MQIRTYKQTIDVIQHRAANRQLNMDNEEKEGPAHSVPTPRPTLSGCGNYWLFLCVHSHESMLLQWWQTPPGLSTNAAKTDTKKTPLHNHVIFDSMRENNNTYTRVKALRNLPEPEGRCFDS